MNVIKKAVLAIAMLGTVAGATLPATAQVSIGIRIGPPPPRYEVVPAPRPGYYWRAGHWIWNGRRYVWVRGFWAVRPAGYAYRAWVPGHWVHRPAGWVWVEGHWR